jgi:hypothetical protein
MDDLLLGYPVPGDVIRVPAGMDIAKLAASTVSNGAAAP